MTGPQPTGVLMLSAVAGRLGGPDTGEEQRQVDRVIREARYRDGLTLRTAQAVQGEDILGHLLDHEPTVLGDLLAAAGKKVRLVVLNACGTDLIAQDLAEVTGCAIGYPAKVSDRMAITFATQFYRCVGAGIPVGPAHEAARAVIRMYGADENELPILRHSPAVNMDALHLLHPAFLPPPPAQGRIPDATAFLARGAGTKRYTLLATGTTDSETNLRAELASRDMNVQWIQLEETTERG
ncbi:hypothetical protein ACF07Y_04735 [Streptomyces sp. NPDC016566]|uniref:hypothetical protein n=1 Tax=Streptomyces sp. NPDC016566 TaxID=3364967 RepID=UPI0036FEF847